jgi:5-methylthioadenosine/S-adenosylhomocysteine deaminase
VGGPGITRQRYRAEAVVTCDAAFSVHTPGVVDVEEGRIAWVGAAREAPPRPHGHEEALPGVLLPGMVNVHGHGPMTLFRGAAEDVALDTFLLEILWPREARLTREDVYWGMSLACAEMLRAGVTTSCDMYLFEDGMADAVIDAGSRCVVTPGVIEGPGWEHLGGWRQRLKAVLDFHADHDGREDRLTVGIGAHSAYALPLEALQAIGTAAHERDALVHIHIAETQGEGRPLEQRHGKTVPALLADIGFLDARILAAHSVWLTDEDLRLFAAHDVAIAHCPQSNAKLASGIARLPELLRAGIRVGLGTDGPASNNNLDLWEEMQLAPLLARVSRGDASLVPARDALALATRGGAGALGRDDIGVLERGRWADMVHVRLDDPALVPVLEDRDLVSHLVWSASSRLVTDVWVAGRQVVRDGACLTVDTARTRAEVELRARRLALL